MRSRRGAVLTVRRAWLLCPNLEVGGPLRGQDDTARLVTGLLCCGWPQLLAIRTEKADTGISLHEA